MRATFYLVDQWDREYTVYASTLDEAIKLVQALVPGLEYNSIYLRKAYLPEHNNTEGE